MYRNLFRSSLAVLFLLIGVLPSKAADVKEIRNVRPSVTSEALLQTTPTGTLLDSVAWDYNDADLTNSGVTVTQFLVCLDGQTVANCSKVPATNGVPVVGSNPAAKTYKWKIPAVTIGGHSVVLKACDATLITCSSGVTFQFNIRADPANPFNLRIGGDPAEEPQR